MPGGASLKSLRVTKPSTRRFPGRSSETTWIGSLCPENRPSRSRSAAYTERTSGISSSSFSARPNSCRKSSACIRTPTRNTTTTATTSPMPVRYHWSGISSCTCLPKNCSRTESTHSTKYRVAISGSTVSSPVRKIRPARFHGELRFGTVHRIIGGGGSMIAVIFEFTPAEGRFPDYMELVGTLKADLDKADGFISLERFESITTRGKFVSLQFWRDEEALRKWRNLQRHREAQAKGRAGIFKSYRLRIASVLRDYTQDERSQAPEDSLSFHSKVHG